MTKPTSPSRRSSHDVYLEDDGSCILEVRRGDTYTLYSIDEKGNEELLTHGTSKYQGTPEDYYLDYLTGDQLNKIDLLTTKYDYSKTIKELEDIILELGPDFNFDMHHFYSLSDAEDALKQIHLFTGEESYLESAKNIEKITDALAKGGINLTAEEVANFTIGIDNTIHALEGMQGH